MTMNPEDLPDIEPQSFFPWEDLRPVNSGRLALLLTQPNKITQLHQQLSWNTAYIDRVNPLVQRIMNQSYLEDWYVIENASIHGSKIFETMLGCVESRVLYAPHAAIGRVEGGIVDLDADGRLAEYRDEAIAHMEGNGGNSLDVTRHCALQAYSKLAYYAIVGAAVSRKISLDIMEEMDIGKYS